MLKLLIPQLTLEEKISLLAGRNFWETFAVPRLDIPSLRVSDGPNGARGGQWEGGTTAACFPASVCLAATWDEKLVAEIGDALAGETISKGARVLNFESFSEDPYLAGRLATAYINGIQARGVGATIKHFAGNEQESRRQSMNSNISERALREIYLKPFEIAVKAAKPWALMTSYMSKYLIRDVLREQWGFKGLVMSDWGGTNSVEGSLLAGLDLEMPGPASQRKIPDIKAAIESGKLTEQVIDERVLAVLRLVKQAGKFENPEELEEQAIDRPEDRALIRKAGAEGAILLKNENGTLPLRAKKVKSIALLGLAKECLAHGGGSASVNCHYMITPYEAFRSRLGNGVDLTYSEGAQTFRNLPPLKENVVGKDGKSGFTLSRFQTQDISGVPESVDSCPQGRWVSDGSPCVAAKLESKFRPTVSGSHYLAFSSLGPATVTIDGKKIFDVTEYDDDAMRFHLGGSVQEQKQFHFEKGEEYDIVMEAFGLPTGDDMFSLFRGMVGIQLGFMLQEEYERDMLAEAVEAAKAAEVAVVFVGNTTAWETEGQDQPSMNLPVNGSQDRLISAVAAVNPNTVIIINTGVAIAMPWLSSVKAVIQSWFPGQEAGNSIADVIFGTINPSGRLPISIPKRLEDTPAFENFPGNLATLQVHYKEEIYIGYRFFDKHPEKIQFPFGFGLSYTDFEIRNIPQEKILILSKNKSIDLHTSVKNIGAVAGSQVVQVYLAPSNTDDRPDKTLAGFAKVTLDAGQGKNVNITVTYESAAIWDEDANLWKVLRGDYKLLVGSSSQDIAGSQAFIVEETFTFQP
ncbi:glycoside hydrolase superfamily [Leptodontidium sp. 2 PMI_412]|nr:glycoside hydrolase superfamily [Leptodontidium sp. 2 PMI_412]